MCFTHHCDWYASINEETTQPAKSLTLCDECHASIQPGETLYHLFQQQYDWCHRCEMDECECPRDADGDCLQGCSCEDPDYGEEFAYDCCMDCRHFLAAVEAAELEAGCEHHESRPPPGVALEYIQEGGASEAKKYFSTAERMYPDLVVSGYLKRIWWTMFGND